MSVWGKVIGGVAGFALGGPIGAIVGAVAGHAVDKIRAEGSEARLEPPTATRQVAFSVAVVTLAAKMAKADGAVTRAEIDAFKRIFHIPPKDMKTVARIFDEAKRDASGFEPYAQQIAIMFHRDRAVLEELLAGLFHIAQADGAVHPAEMQYLRRVAAIFGLETSSFERVRAATTGTQEVDPYTILGVARQASDEEVKRVYRRLSRENHPDALIAKGVPQEFVDKATERMAAINTAYDEVAKQRGLK